VIHWAAYEGRTRTFARIGMAGALAGAAAGAALIAASFAAPPSEANVFLAASVVVGLLCVTGMLLFYGAQFARWRRSGFAPEPHAIRLTPWLPLGFVFAVAGAAGIFATIKEPAPVLVDDRGQVGYTDESGTPILKEPPRPGMMPQRFLVDPEPKQRNQMWRTRFQTLNFVGMALFCPAIAPRRRRPEPEPTPTLSPA
jgi:hypothetical protein